MPRQIYPGQFKFRIFAKQPKQSKLAKRKVEQTKTAVLAKRRADTQKRMANLRESATCTYPIGLVIGLLFRLGPRILIVRLELNVSPIAPCSTFFSIATTSPTDTPPDTYTQTQTHRHTDTQNTQRSPHRTQSKFHQHVQNHRLNSSPPLNCPVPHVVK